MRSKKKIMKEVSGSFVIEGNKAYGHTGEGIVIGGNSAHANEYLFLEVLCDIRDQLAAINQTPVKVRVS